MPYSEEAIDVASQIPHIALNPGRFDVCSRNAVVFKAVICVFIPLYMHLYMWHLCDPLRRTFSCLRVIFQMSHTSQCSDFMGYLTQIISVCLFTKMYKTLHIYLSNPFPLYKFIQFFSLYEITANFFSNNLPCFYVFLWISAQGCTVQ